MFINKPGGRHFLLRLALMHGTRPQDDNKSLPPFKGLRRYGSHGDCNESTWNDSDVPGTVLND